MHSVGERVEVLGLPFAPTLAGLVAARRSAGAVMTVVEDRGLSADDLPDLLDAGRKHLWMQDQRASDLQARGQYDILVSGDGCHLHDIAGNRLIDGNSSGFVRSIGHRRRELVDAVTDQLLALAYAPIAHGCATTPAIRLAAKIAERAPGSLTRTFFCGGGGEAIEVAVKLAKQFQHISGYPKKTKIISRRPEYHGSTYAAMSLGGHADRNCFVFEPLMPGVLQVDAPHCGQCPWGYQDRKPGECCNQSLRSLRNLIAAEGAGTIAAFVATPYRVGGSPPGPEYWPAVRQICSDNDILLIADEITTGFGRLGAWFGLQRFGVTPDIMTIGKGLTSGELPVGGVVATQEIAEAFDRADRKLGNFHHGVSFGAHAAVMAVGLRNLEIIEAEDLVARSASLGRYFHDQLVARLRERHAIVGDVFGGYGLLASIALVRNRRTGERYPGGFDGPFLVRLNEILRANGLFVRAAHVTNLAPPLIATRDLIDEIVDILDVSLTQIAREFPPDA